MTEFKKALGGFHLWRPQTFGNFRPPSPFIRVLVVFDHKIGWFLDPPLGADLINGSLLTSASVRVQGNLDMGINEVWDKHESYDKKFVLNWKKQSIGYFWIRGA